MTAAGRADGGEQIANDIARAIDWWGGLVIMENPRPPYSTSNPLVFSVPSTGTGGGGGGGPRTVIP